MSSTVFLVLRRMRAPLIVLIVIYSVSILGLTLVPGIDAEGNPTPPMNIFHAFYLVSYTATTIGFGEIPNAFSDQQRLWVTISIYLLVIGWSYSIVTILTLIQEKAFRSTMAANQFGRRVRRLTEPFYLVAGAGATGTLVARSLARLDRQCVIVESNDFRVQELDLEDLATNPPMLAADARLPETLVLAGLRHPQCHGVMALTDDNEVNLAIAIAARLLNPEHPVLARSTDPLVAANMSSFGTDHVIDPFHRFAEELAMSISAPDTYRLVELLTSLPGEPMPELHRPPRGRWIVVGYGRFGRAVVRQLVGIGSQVTVIDPAVSEAEGVRFLTRPGSEAATLLEAGIDTAHGVVAATDSDVHNLAIAMTANELNPKIFVVSRQNEAANTLLFDAFESDFAMVPTTIVAEECVAIVTTPMLNRFVQEVRTHPQAWCAGLVARLQDLCEGRVPLLWGVSIDNSRAPAVEQALARGETVHLGDLMHDSIDRDYDLPMLALMHVRSGQVTILPEADLALEPGDGLLFAGAESARRRLTLTALNANMLSYVMTGRERNTGWIWQLLTRPVTLRPGRRGPWTWLR